MLRTSSLTGLLTILQSIDMADEDKVDKNDGNETNLSNSSAFRRSIWAGYLTFRNAKRGGCNTKKGVKAARDSDYLTLAVKNAFNHSRHAFTQLPIF